MKRWDISLMVLALLATLCSLAACSSAERSMEQPAAGEQPAGGLSAFPLPLDLPGRDAAFAHSDGHRFGYEFDSELPNNRIVNVGTAGRFMPVAASSTPRMSELSYSIYHFQLHTLDSDGARLDLLWNSDLDSGQRWVGLSNFDSNRWDWHGPAGSESIELEELGQYLDAFSNFYVAVVVMGDALHDLAEVEVTVPGGPVAVLSSDLDSGTAPFSVSFSAADSYDSDGSIADYQWDFDGDKLYGESGPEAAAAGMSEPAPVVFATAGLHEVHMRVVDNTGKRDRARLELYAAASLPPIAMLSGEPLAGVAPLDVAFSALGSNDTDGGGLVDYEWDFDSDGLYNEESAGEAEYQGLALASHVFKLHGNFEVRVRVTSADGDMDGAMLVVALGNHPPVSTLNADPENGLAPLTVSLDGSASLDSDGSIEDFEWDFDGDGIFNEAGQEASARGIAEPEPLLFEETGYYSISLRVTDNGGLSAVDTVSVTAGPVMPPEAVLVVDPLDADAPAEVSCDASGSSDPDGTIVDIEWDLDGDNFFNEIGAETLARGNPTPVPMQFPLPQYYTFRVRVTDDDGLSDTAEQTILLHGWYFVDIDQAAAVGDHLTYVDIAMVGDGPALVYTEYTGLVAGRMRFLRSRTRFGTQRRDWLGITVPDNVEIPIDAALADVDGSPALAYGEGKRGKSAPRYLYYMRAAGDGLKPEHWSDPVLIDARIDGCYANDMLVVDDRPAMVHTVRTPRDDYWAIEYNHAADIHGASEEDWLSPVVVHSMTELGGGNVTEVDRAELALVDGHPAVAYWYRDYEDHRILFCRSSSASGDSGSDWAVKSTAATVDGAMMVHRMGLAVTEGRPCISYVDFENWTLNYAVALDPEGISWAPKVTLANGVYMYRQDAALATTFGRPTIVAWGGIPEGGGVDIRLSRAESPDGLEAEHWPVPESFDPEAAGQTWSVRMMAIDGHPALVYIGNSTDMVRYAVNF